MKPIFYHSGKYAMEAGTLDQYRESLRENRRTASALDAAVSAVFDGCRLDSAAVLSAVLDLAGCTADRVSLVLAASIADRAGDGRISAGNRTWSESVRMPDDADDSGQRWYVVRMHSVLLDELAAAWRARQ